MSNVQQAANYETAASWPWSEKGLLRNSLVKRRFLKLIQAVLILRRDILYFNFLNNKIAAWRMNW